MAFSSSKPRSKSQDSPMFWLSLIAGSLVLHLVVLWVGRWYLSRMTSAPAGNSQAPLDFVEIDPNAPPLREAKPNSTSYPQGIAPSSNSTAPVPKAPLPVTPEQNQPSSIENLARQTAPERSQPRPTPSPLSPVKPAEQPQAGQLPIEPPKPTPTPTSIPTPESTPRPTPAFGSNPAQAPATGGSTGSTSTPGSSTPSQPAPAPGTSTPPTPAPSLNGTQPNGTQTGESSASGGAVSGTSLSREATFQGKIAQTLERDPNERQRDGARSITVKNDIIPPLSIMFPSKLPVQVLDLKVLVVMDRQGQVFSSKVQDDSPSFQTNPELKESKIRENVQATVDQLFLSSNNLFEVVPEGNTTPDQLFSRIAQLQIKVSQ
jgi:hypothetical protein